MKSKAQWREESQALFSLKDSGKLAQRLRGVKSYRESRQIFVSPAPFLSQVRINALLDGKELVMPGPGLKQGFFLLKPFSVPFPKLLYAVSLGGVHEHGTVLSSTGISELDLGLFISEAMVVNEEGVRIGDGTGFFDLAVAILQESGGISKSFEVFAALSDQSQFVSEELPSDPWDIPVRGILTQDLFREVTKADATTPKLYWDELARKTVKKIDPLWKLSCNVFKESRV